MRGVKGVILGLIVTVLVGALIFGNMDFPPSAETLDFDDTGPRLVALSALAFVFIASLIFGQPRISEILRGVFFWGGLMALLVTGYTFRHDLIQGGYRVLGALSPGLAVPQQDGSILVVKDASGHFTLEAGVNGTSIRFLLDTGASAVVLTYQDAIRAGFSAQTLSFAIPVQTANGRALVAPVRIDDLTVANIRLNGVRAFVARDGALVSSLFGMSALDRLSGWRIEGDRLIMTP